MKLLRPLATVAALSIFCFIGFLLIFFVIHRIDRAVEHPLTPQILLVLLGTSVIAGLSLFGIPLLFSSIDRAAVPGFGTRASVLWAAQRTALLLMLVLIGGFVAFHVMVGKPIRFTKFDNAFTGLPFNLVVMELLCIGLAYDRIRELEKFVSPALRQSERAGLKSFGKYEGRRGALVLTNERLIFASIDGSNPVAIPRSSIENASLTTSLGFVRGFHFIAMQKKWSFVMPDPHRWIEAIGEKTQPIEARS